MLIILIIILVIGLFLGLIYYFFTHTLGQGMNRVNALQEQMNQLQSAECPQPKTVTGPQGPKGPAGRSGGVFQKQGPMRSVGNPTMVMDRLAGLGPASVSYLADMNYTTHQTWTLESDTANLKNEYGGCLYGDGETGLVYMSDCKTASPQGAQWIYDNFGRLKLKSDEKKCLTPKYQGIVKDVENQQNLNFNGQKLSKESKFLQVKLDECGKADEQKWAFY